MIDPPPGGDTALTDPTLLVVANPEPSNPRVVLADELRRVVDRLHGMALVKLGAPWAPEPSRADAARRIAQWLADAASAVESPGDPVWRDVPELADAASGDQVSVCGQDLLSASDGVPDDCVVPLRIGGVATLDALLLECAALVRDLRLRL